MSKNTNRHRTKYDLSKQAEEVKGLLYECFPFARLFVEYPYAFLLQQHYKRSKVPTEEQDRYLLSQKRLHADFVLPDYKCIIEVDGEQHFQPVRFGGVSQETAESNLEDQKYRDDLKRRICMEMDYKLVRIRYDQEVNEDVIFELIKHRGF